jgi:hypothetical protein
MVRPATSAVLVLALSTLLLLAPADTRLSPAPAAAYVHTAEPVLTQTPSWAGPVTGGDGASISDYLTGRSWFRLDTGGSPQMLSIEREMMTELEVGSRVVPAFETVPVLQTLALGPIAFAAGWKIGTAINTKWLHLAGVGLGQFSEPPGSPVVSARWTYLSTGLNANWPDPAWYLQVTTADGWSTRTWHDCSGITDYYTRSRCADPAPSAADQTNVYNWVHNTFHSDGVIRGVPSGISGVPQTEADYITPSRMRAALAIDQPLQAFTTQTVGITSGWTDPATGAGITINAPPFNVGPSNPSPQWPGWADIVDTLPDGSRNDFNCHLDHSYDCPTASPDGTSWTDPGGKTLTLPTPSTSETYDAYVARLQSLGFVGSTYRIDLDADSADSDFVSLGVPCTVPSDGSRVRIASTLTLYVNPSVFGANNFNTTPMCGGRLATTRLTTKCDFSPSNHRWEDVVSGPDAAFYEQACNDAWAYFWANQAIFDITDDNSGGLKSGVTPGGLINHIREVTFLGDQLVKSFLGASDPDLSHWQKAKTTTFAGPYPFQLHFYYNTVTREVRFDLDFKLKFNNFFSP